MADEDPRRVEERRAERDASRNRGDAPRVEERPPQADASRNRGEAPRVEERPPQADASRNPGPGDIASRPRRERGVRESLLSIVLGMEAVVMFFVTLVVFGLHILAPLPAFLGGGIAFVVLAALAGLQGRSWAVYIGAAAQLGLILLGVLTPVMYLIGAGFAALWLYCFLRSRQIERQRRLAAESESS